MLFLLFSLHWPFPAKLYTDLAVIYTQLMLYDKAIEASKKAIAILDSQSGQNGQTSKMQCILYQNLGAIYNFKGQYALSIDCHSKATQGFGNTRFFT